MRVPVLFRRQLAVANLPVHAGISAQRFVARLQLGGSSALTSSTHISRCRPARWETGWRAGSASQTCCRCTAEISTIRRRTARRIGTRCCARRGAAAAPCRCGRRAVARYGAQCRADIRRRARMSSCIPLGIDRPPHARARARAEFNIRRGCVRPRHGRHASSRARPARSSSNTGCGSRRVLLVVGDGPEAAAVMQRAHELQRGRAAAHARLCD